MTRAAGTRRLPGRYTRSGSIWFGTERRGRLGPTPCLLKWPRVTRRADAERARGGEPDEQQRPRSIGSRASSLRSPPTSTSTCTTSSSAAARSASRSTRRRAPKPASTSTHLALATRLISRELDHDDPIPGHYTLEVTSPGLERKLRTPAHFQREIGKTVARFACATSSTPRAARGADCRRRAASRPTSAPPRSAPRRGADRARSCRHRQIDRARTVFVLGPRAANPARQPRTRKATRRIDSRSGHSSSRRPS